MQQNTSHEQDRRIYRKAILIAAFLILVSAAVFYFLFPLLGIAITLTATTLLLLIATIAVFSIAMLLFFVLPGAFILLGSGLAALWTILAIILFPVLFPLIMPIFIILLFVAYVRKPKKTKG